MKTEWNPLLVSLVHLLGSLHASVSAHLCWDNRNIRKFRKGTYGRHLIQLKPRSTMWSEPIFLDFFLPLNIWILKEKSKFYKVPTYL